MSRILIRSGKDPFTPVAAESTLAQDVFNTNVGNYLFAHSVHKALMTDGTELVSNATLSEARRVTADDIARVNDEFDAFVVPLANAFRPQFMRRLENLTALVEGLTIPVVVVGVGAQSSASFDLESLEALTPTVRAFVSAVLDRSESIGVRGEFTADFLTEMGFPADRITVIGCPSLYLHGPGFRLSPKRTDLDASSPVALNVTAGVDGLGALVERLVEAFPGLVYVAQDRDDLRLLLWGEEPEDVDERLPLHRDHPLFRQDRVRFPLDVWTWIDYLGEFDFAVGTRLHGNVAALLADTPATLLVHDSRTRELAELHGLPHRRVEDVIAEATAQDLLDAFDPTPFNRRYDRLFTGFTDFLERNGLPHVYDDPGSPDAFEKQVAQVTFPPLVGPLHGGTRDEVAARLRWLRDGQAFDSALHRQAYRQPFPVPAPAEPAGRHNRAHERAERKIARLERQLATARDQVRRQQRALTGQRKRLAALEEQLTRLEQRSLLRRVGRRLRPPR